MAKKRKTISVTATYYAVNTKGINKKKKNWFFQTSSLQFGQFHPAMKFLFQCLPKLELPGSEEDQASVLSTESSEDTVSDVVYPPSLYHSSFLKENVMI